MAKRANSGYNKPVPGKYSSTEVGKWRETPAAFRPPTLPFWGKVTPFVLTTQSQFRAPPPYTVDSKEYAAELSYVNKVGARDGADRTDYQTMTTPFWSDDLGTATPPGHWNIIAEGIARSKNLSVPETARLFALLNIAEADTAIAIWETKFFYNTWRPETAIRELDPKVNPNACLLYTSLWGSLPNGAVPLAGRFDGDDEVAPDLDGDVRIVQHAKAIEVDLAARISLLRHDLLVGVADVQSRRRRRRSEPEAEEVVHEPIMKRRCMGSIPIWPSWLFYEKWRYRGCARSGRGLGPPRRPRPGAVPETLTVGTPTLWRCGHEPLRQIVQQRGHGLSLIHI